MNEVARNETRIEHLYQKGILKFDVARLASSSQGNKYDHFEHSYLGQKVSLTFHLLLETEMPGCSIPI